MSEKKAPMTDERAAEILAITSANEPATLTEYIDGISELLAERASLQDELAALNLYADSVKDELAALRGENEQMRSLLGEVGTHICNSDAADKYLARVCAALSRAK